MRCTLYTDCFISSLKSVHLKSVLQKSVLLKSVLLRSAHQRSVHPTNPILIPKTLMILMNYEMKYLLNRILN